MLKFNLSLKEALSPYLFNKPLYLSRAFEPSEQYLEQFLNRLYDPLCGAESNLVEVWYNSESVNPESWTHQLNNSQHHYRDINALKKAISLKCSVVFDEYFRYSMTIRKLITMIQAQFGCYAGCNAYYSQLGGKAFPAHRDCHHVLIFAVSGKKKWTVYNQKQDMFFAHNNIKPGIEDEQIKANGIATEVIMEPGDILYIPIGQFHEVENLTDNALHYTISMLYKPFSGLLEDVMSTIYEKLNSDNTTPELLQLLNQLHPVYANNSVEVDKDQLLQSLPELFKLIELTVKSDAFDEKVQKGKNPLLNILTIPADDWKEQLVDSCSTS